MVKIVVLVSADDEWIFVRDSLGPGDVPRSPFGEWFQYDIHVQQGHVDTTFFQTGCGKMPASADWIGF